MKWGWEDSLYIKHGSECFIEQRHFSTGYALRAWEIIEMILEMMKADWRDATKKSEWQDKYITFELRLQIDGNCIILAAWI